MAIPADPPLPPFVRSLLTRCLEKDPLRRPQSAHEALPDTELVPSAAPAAAARRRTIPGLAAAGVLALVLGVVVWMLLAAKSVQFAPPAARFALLAGIFLALGSFPLGWAVRKWLGKHHNQIEQEATRLVLGAQSRRRLTETLALEVDKLIEQLERLDDRIVGISIAIMVQEFKSASKPEARQKALMQMMELLEKVRYRLTPWYVRHDKLIAVVVSVLTCVSGVATAAANLMKAAGHP